MRMPMKIKIGLIALLGVVITLLVEEYSFGLVHSPGAMVLAVLFSPGLILLFFNIDANEHVLMAFVAVINIVYLLAIFGLFRVLKKKSSSSGRSEMRS